MAEGSSITILNTMTRDLAASPTIISPVSLRKESLRSSNNAEKGSSPSPPLPRLMRKRAASLNTDAANDPSIENLSLHSASLENLRIDPGSQVCLCQPDPKIPRPRNAFILYRQHYQGQVITQNPGLANPEISKIIGAQWRDQPLEVKNEWKRLAEEEKHRHQRQYPDYRYQPRRPGKLNGPRIAVSPEDPLRCPKCSGRYISTPGTPLTPFPPTPSMRNHNDKAIPPLSRSGAETAMDGESRYTTNAPMPLNEFRSGPPYPQIQHHRPPLNLDQSSRQWPEPDIDMVQSPRAKRPRPNDDPNPYPSPSWPNGPQRLGRVPMSVTGYDPARIINQRGISYQHHSNTGMIEPPPRSTPISAQFPHNTPGHVRPQNMDDLRLPPLQTKITGSGSTPLQQPQFQSPSQLQRNSNLSHSQTVKSIVMTIPFINKIRVLAKIAPPLLAPGVPSPVGEVRGPVIAVEGADSKLVSEVGRYIEECLNQNTECFVQTWTSGNASVEKNPESTMTDVSMSGTDSNPIAPGLIDLTKDSQNNDPIMHYLEEIRSWHSKSAEIRKFVTTPPPPTVPASKASESPSNLLTPAAAPSPIARLPVALIPTGFSLSLSDRAATQIPVNDAYAPVDHWQWMATLWRGIIGVDLTVYVCSGAQGDESGGRGGPSVAGGVEVRNDIRAIVVYVAGDKVEDKWLRRVGFEVGEFVIGGVLKG